MAKKLSLGPDSGSSKSKKDNKNEHVTPGKASHRSGKKTTSRKEKTGQHSSDHSSVWHSSSQEQLDSGLGSIDSQLQEAPWSDHHYGIIYGSSHHTQSIRQQYCPPCSCCSHGPPPQGTTPAFHNQQYSLRPVSSHGSDMYSPPPYSSYGAYPASMRPYSQPTDFQRSRSHSHQQQKYWSVPFGAPPLAVRGQPGELPCWEPPLGTQPNPSRGKEREAVRKKLLAIFSAHLVDRAMDLFPQLMDPQMLVAEILMLQSEDRSLR